jgi:filamentous hemagglutinin
LNHQLASQELASGHVFDKHVIQNGEFPGIITRDEFAKYIENIMNTPSDFKSLSNGRTAYWDDASQTVVIRDPRTADGGTPFKPT